MTYYTRSLNLPTFNNNDLSVSHFMDKLQRKSGYFIAYNSSFNLYVVYVY